MSTDALLADPLPALSLSRSGISGTHMEGGAWDGRGVGMPHDSREYHIDDDGPGPSERSLRRAEEEDVIGLLDEEEALELVEFDPKVESKDTWPPPKAMRSFLEKHFNKSLSEEEREAIFPETRY